MSLDLDDAFEVDSVIVNEKAALLSGDADPTAPGVIAPIGSLYMRTDGRHYRKTGGLDNDWEETDLGGGGGGSGFQGLGQWRYRTATNNTPTAGRLQFDDTAVDNATEMYVNVTNDGSVDMTNFLALITAGDLIYIQDSGVASKFIICEVGTGVLSAGVYTFPLTLVESQGTAITNNTTVSFVAAHSGQAADQLQFTNRAGASENITIVITPTTYLTFFNRAGAPENIGII